MMSSDNKWGINQDSPEYEKNLDDYSNLKEIMNDKEITESRREQLRIIAMRTNDFPTR